MAEKGVVIDIHGNIAVVSIKRSAACSACGVCRNDKNQMIMEAINVNNAVCGDLVDIEINEGYFLKSVFVIYGIPLMSLLSGFVLGYYLSNYFGFFKLNNFISFVVGIIFMSLSFFLIRLKEKDFNKNKIMPQAIKR